MSNSTRTVSRRGVLCGFAAAAVVCVTPAVNAAEQTSRAASKANSKESTKSAAAEIALVVDQALAKSPYYFPGALISRADVSPIFEKLLTQGLMNSEDQEHLYGSILADQSTLVKRLKTPAGRAFMKKIVTDKTAYHRLARISWTADGRKLLDSFLASKDGFEKFQKLKTPADLAQVSKQLASDPRTQVFALPTGQILTADDLVKKLEELATARDKRQQSAESSRAR
jgi:hypothetical protein